jgi:tetrahydromethanopterin S-methyltransferase subunit C
VLRAWLMRVCVALAVGAAPLAVAGCTTVVAGSPAPMAVPEPALNESTYPPAETSGPRSGLDADVLPDECLLNASEFGDLVGVAVEPPEQGTVKRSDGSNSASCVATSGSEPVAMINVYGVESGTPADYVRAGGGAGRHELPDLGAAAVVIDTATGPTLQLASPQYLVTILVSGSTPSDDAWQAAAEAALSRLPG